MQFFTALTLLSTASLSVAQHNYKRDAQNGPYFVYASAIANPTGGTAVAFATGAYATGNPTGGAVVINNVYTTQLIVTDCGNGTMIYQPVTTVPAGAGHYANQTAATLIPATPSVQDALPPLSTPAAAPVATGGNGDAAPTPEAYMGSASLQVVPKGLTPYITTIAGLALFALVV